MTNTATKKISQDREVWSHRGEGEHTELKYQPSTTGLRDKKKRKRCRRKTLPKGGKTRKHRLKKQEKKNVDQKGLLQPGSKMRRTTKDGMVIFCPILRKS